MDRIQKCIRDPTPTPEPGSLREADKSNSEVERFTSSWRAEDEKTRQTKTKREERRVSFERERESDEGMSSGGGGREKREEVNSRLRPWPWKFLGPSSTCSSSPS